MGEGKFSRSVVKGLLLRQALGCGTARPKSNAKPAHKRVRGNERQYYSHLKNRMASSRDPTSHAASTATFVVRGYMGMASTIT